MPSQCSIYSQDHFGPVNNDCYDGFDLTLLFEETILAIGPLSLVLLVLPFRLHALSKADPKVRFGLLHTLKLVSVLHIRETVFLSRIVYLRYIYSPSVFSTRHFGLTTDSEK